MRPKLPRRFWTAEETADLRRLYPDTPMPELIARFGRPVHAIYRKAYDLGLHRSAAYLAGPHAFRFRRPDGLSSRTQFKPGQPPWNKGLKGTGGHPPTQFKPGARPHSWVSIGTERMSTEGYLKRKLTDTGAGRHDWEYVHVLLWRERHGPIPPGHVVIFVNGDKTDIRIENLDCIHRRALAYLNKHGYHDLPAEARPSAIALARLSGALADARDRT